MIYNILAYNKKYFKYNMVWGHLTICKTILHLLLSLSVSQWCGVIYLPNYPRKKNVPSVGKSLLKEQFWSTTKDYTQVGRLLQPFSTLFTGETPYECRICAQKFRTHHNYSLHGKNLHGVK